MYGTPSQTSNKTTGREFGISFFERSNVLFLHSRMSLWEREITPPPTRTAQEAGDTDSVNAPTTRTTLNRKANR